MRISVPGVCRWIRRSPWRNARLRPGDHGDRSDCPNRLAFDWRPEIEVKGKTYKLYWGDLHCHGNLSGDAEGEIDENYAYGRYKARLDFMAVTDNDVLYDNILTPSELKHDPGGGRSL